MSKYIRLNAEVEAIQWTGTNDEDTLYAFYGHVMFFGMHAPYRLEVRTPTGSQRVEIGDYIVKDCDTHEAFVYTQDEFNRCFKKVEESYAKVGDKIG